MKRGFLLVMVLWFGAAAQLFSAQENLLKAIEDGKTDLVKQIVDKNPKLVLKNQKEVPGTTLLHVASRFGQKPLVTYLIEKKADVNAKDDDGWAPLHLATYGGFKGSVEILLENGADINLTCPGGTVLHVAAMAGHSDLVEFYLGKGLKVNEKFGDKGWTPLHSACYGGFFSSVRLLVKKGADVRDADADGNLPYTIANNAGFPEIAAFLDENGGGPGE